MTARLNLIGDAWNNKTTIQTGTPITTDPKLTQITELMSAFSNGEINFSTLKARLTSLDVTVSGTTTKASFTYGGKTYNVQQKTGAYYKNTTFSSSTLRDIYKLTDEQINTYFTKKSETEYELNKSSGCKTIGAVLAKVADQYRNDMLLANFLNDKNKTTNSTTELKKTSDNKTISSYNYQDYIDEIQSTLGTDTDAAKKKALDKFITDFTQGNVAFATVSAILKAIGVEYKLSNKVSDVGIQFTYDNKTYQLSCKLKAASKGTDDKTVETYSADSLTQTGATQTLINKYFDSVTTVDGKAQTYALKATVTYTQFLAEVEKEKAPETFSYSELKNSYKFTDDVINTYFKEETSASAKPDTGAAANKAYVLNKEAGCESIDDVEEKMAEQYEKAMVLVNFLNDKNKKTDNVDDMKKAGDGNTITKDNYQKYADEIKKALGNDKDAIAQKVLEKLVKDYTEGNISMLMVGLITKSIGGSNSHFALKGLELGFGFEYDGKTYQMYTNASAVGSGVDTNSVKTYTAEELQKTGATQDQINNYFVSSLEIDGVTKSYHLRSARTYAQFEEEVKASQKKNGVETSTNAQGCKVETTYVDGVVTKVVEYKEDGKNLAKETEYFANGQAKQEIKYDSFYNTKASETEYYENGQVKHEIKYNGLSREAKVSETEYNENGQVKLDIKYSSGKKASETEYYDNGQVKHETKYTYGGRKESEVEYYENGKTKSEIEYDYQGEVDFKNEYDSNGKLQTRTEYDYYGKHVTTYNSDGSNVKTTYDKETNKPIKEVRTSADGTVRYFAIELADDGSKTLTEYKRDPSGYVSDSDRVGVEKYDAQGRLTYKSKYQSTYLYTDTKYIYNEDGSRREVSYSEHSDSPNSPRNIASDKTYDKNGRLVRSASYGGHSSNDSGLPTTEVLYSYDSNGEISTKTTIEYRVDWSSSRCYEQTKKSETVTDKNGKVLSKVTYESFYQDEYTGEDIQKKRRIETINDGDKSTVTTYIENQLSKEVVTDNAKNTKTITTYKNGKKAQAIVQDLNGNKISEILYNSNGKLLFEVKVTKNGNDTEETTTFADGRTAVRKNGATSAVLKDKNGETVGSIERHNAKVVTGTTIDEVIAGKKYDCLDIKNKNGEITSRIIYNPDGTVNYTQTYTYEYTDSKNYKIIIKDPNGDTHTEVYENGKKTKTLHWYKATSSAIVQEEGKGSAYSRLTGSTRLGGQNVEAKTLYTAITDLNARTFIYRNSTLIKNEIGDLTLEYLQMAQPRYNGKPSGSDKTYVGYKNAPSNAQAHIKEDLEATVPEYGYNPEDVKGYHYSTTSALSKKISTDQDFTKYVKNNIKNLINGTNLLSTRLDFNNDQDLSNSLHGTDVVATKLEGTKLTITIYDLYDFENLQGNTKTDILNRAGYSAMKDGKLKPYYVLIDVVIDLSKSPYNMTQAQINKIAGK